MRRTLSLVAFALLLTIGSILVVPDDSGFPVVQRALAQAPLPEPLNNTTLPIPDPAAPDDPGDAYYENIIIVATARQSFRMVPERGSAVFEIDITDYSLPGAEATKPTPVPVNCGIVNETANPDRKWSMQQTLFPQVRRHGEAVATMTVTALPFTTPEYYSAEVVCIAGAPIAGREVGRFNLTARVEEYSYLTLLPVGVPPTAGPDEIVTHTVNLKNNGNQLTTFIGQMDVPPGWRATFPEQVVLRPGESRDLTIQVWTPREKLVYISEAELLQVAYYPADEPGKIRWLPFSVQVSGVYLHPALVPLTVLTVGLVAVLVFFAILARRTVEERILGKPVPPWRIPVEREYLQRLMKEDPDQYYIVRYYLMVEEHQSALLWFEAFKEATKKDRKRESKWYKVKRKQERKVIRLEKAHNKFVAGWDKDTDKPGRVAERKKHRLERKLRRKERKQQRKVNRKHKKRSKKLVKKHEKRVAKATKKFEKKREKELKKIEKANRKREKKGEEPLPLPEIEPPTFEEPVVGEPDVIPEVPLMESRYAKRAERLDARAARKRERLLAKRERRIAKDRRRVDIKSEKLRNKIPPEPQTALYAADEYVPEDQVIVEDDRSALAKWLFLPTLEEQDRARRRRQVHRAELQQAQEAGDEEKVARLRQEWADERSRQAAERKERVRGTMAQRKEDRRLAVARKQELKERARRIKHDDEPPERDASLAPPDTEPKRVQHRSEDSATERPARVKGFKLGKRNARSKDEAEAKPEESPPAPSDES